MQEEEQYSSLLAVVDGFEIHNEADPEEPLYMSRDREERLVMQDYTDQIICTLRITHF